MMNIQYKRENHKSYIVLKNEYKETSCCQLETGDCFDSTMELKSMISMICSNKVDGLLDVTRQIYNGEEELYFDISGKQPLSILYEKKQMRKADLEYVLRGIKSAIEEAENYLIDTEYLVISPEYIYVDLSSRMISLLLNPYQEEMSEESANAFAEYLLEKIPNDENETVLYAYNFYRIVKEEQGDLASAIRRLFEEEVEDIGLHNNGKKSEQNEKKCVKGEIYSHYEESKNTFDDEALDRDEGLDLFFDDSEVSDEKWKTTDTMSLGNETKTIFAFLLLGAVGIGGLVYCFFTYQMSFSTILMKKEVLLLMALLVVSIVGLLFLGIRLLLRKRHKSKNKNKVECDEKAKQKIIRSDYEIEDCMGDDVEYDDSTENLFFRNNDEIRSKGKDDGQDEILDHQNYETVLIADQAYREERVLIGKIRGRKKEIDLSSFPFFVGKSAQDVDYAISDSSVSRIHAKFSLRDDMVFLTDLNSTNCTYKNGIRLQPNEMSLLEVGDEITFGKVSFVYQ